MQLNLYLLLSIWLLAVAALPTLDPRLWKTYGVYNTFTSPDPPFPPPDIGPLDLPEDYFNDYPDLTENQITLIRQENMKNHKRHQKEIARQWRETGKHPTEEELGDRAREIREKLKETCQEEQVKARDAAYVPPPLSRPALIKRIKSLKVQIQQKTRALEIRLGQNFKDQGVLQECERDVHDAESLMKYYRNKITRMTAQIQELRAQQHGLAEDSQEYLQLEQQIQQAEARKAEATTQFRQARDAAQRASWRTGQTKGRIKSRSQKIQQLKADIQKLREELEALRKDNPPPGPNPKDPTKDRKNSFSMTALENGARQWIIQGVGGFLQDVNRRASTKGGDIRLRPFDALPKPGLIGVP